MPRLPFFRGWLVVAGAFGVTFVGFGSAYTFSAFLEPLQRDFAASRGSVSLVFALAGCLYFSLGVVAGPLADRWGPRPVAAAGMVLAGAGLALAGIARSLDEVMVAYGLGMGLGIGASYVPAVGSVQRWFARRRGFASGIAVSGIGVGTLAMPPLAALLIAAWGWRNAYLALGAGAAVAGVGAALLLARDPRDHGLGPDGDPPRPAGPGGPGAGFTLGEAVRAPYFAVLYAACMASGIGVFVPFVHLAPYAIDRGVAPATATLLVGAIGAGSTAGRFLLGGLADRIGRRHALIAMFAGMALSLVVWSLAGASLALLGAFACAFGVFYGGWVAVMPAVTMDAFGGRAVGSIIGVLYTSVALGTLLGPPAAGFAFDASGSYRLPILAAAAAHALAAAIVALAPPPQPRR